MYCRDGALSARQTRALLVCRLFATNGFSGSLISVVLNRALDLFQGAVSLPQPSTCCTRRRTMQFDLHLPIGEIHASEESLKSQILKAQTFATNVGSSCPRPSRLRTKAIAKGSVRFLTALTASRRTPSWRQINVWPQAFNRSDADTSHLQAFQVTEARSLPDPSKARYLAVSYCWARGSEAERQGESEPCYYIRDARAPKRVRGSRARRSIIDRAIAFAIDRDIHMIWIDQECS